MLGKDLLDFGFDRADAAFIHSVPIHESPTSLPSLLVMAIRQAWPLSFLVVPMKVISVRLKRPAAISSWWWNSVSSLSSQRSGDLRARRLATDSTHARSSSAVSASRRAKALSAGSVTAAANWAARSATVILPAGLFASTSKAAQIALTQALDELRISGPNLVQRRAQAGGQFVRRL